MARTNADPAMEIVCRKRLDVWSPSGGNTFAAFAFVTQPGPHGAWGLLEGTDQPVAQAPNAHALRA